MTKTNGSFKKLPCLVYLNLQVNSLTKAKVMGMKRYPKEFVWCKKAAGDI